MATDSPAPRTRAAWPQMLPALITFVSLFLAVVCLYVARPVLIPAALAILLTFLLAPLTTLLQRRGLPRGIAVGLVVCLAALVLGGIAWLVVSQLAQLAADLPVYQDNVAQRIVELRERGDNSIVVNVQQFVQGITAAATRPAGGDPSSAAAETSVPVTIVDHAGSGILWWLRGLGPLAEPVATLGLALLLLIYLLLKREDLRNRVLSLVGRGHLTQTTKALDDAGRRISRYLLAQFILNLSFGVVIGVGLLLLGVPHAVLWGFTAGVLRYIPYIGPWMAASLPITVSLLISPGWMLPLGVIGLFVVCELSSNLAIEPWVFGHSIGVSQPALIVAIAFWTWLWGPMGLVLAAPLTVCLVVLGKYVPALKFFDVLLGDEPVLTPETNFYQRLLARDEDEAAEIVREQAQTLSPVAICDQLLVPALVAAGHDRHAGQLSDDEYEFIRQAIQQIAEDEDIVRAAAAAVAATAAAATAELKGEAADAAPPGSPLPILACAAQNGVEVTALGLLQQLLDPRQFDLEILSATSLVSEIVEIVEERRPAAICIAALPPGGLAHTRHLSKRLRQRFPELKIIVGRWGSGPVLENRADWTNYADYVATTLEESLRQLGELTQFLRPAHVSSGTKETLAAEGPHRLPEPHTPYVAARTGA
jgi:predicted PurR-regulated permease PerM